VTQHNVITSPQTQPSPTDGGEPVWPSGLHPDGRRRRFLGGPKKAIATALVTVLALLFIVPFYWLLVSALRPSERIFADAGNFLPSAITLENFQNLFSQTPIVTWFFNSVILTVGSTVGSMVVVTMAAYALAKIQFPFRNTIFVGILASQMLPFHQLLIPLFLLMIDLSLIDTHLGVIVPLLAHPFGLFFMRQYMLGLPQDVFDAALVDGASEYQIFRQVVVPMVKPALATLAVLFAFEQWNDLLWPLIVMRSEDNFPLSVGIASLIGLYRPRWDLVVAAALVSVIPVAVLFMMLRNVFLSGLGKLGTGAK
jgi:ABC-type glycerol-3-phosphate transport system permease component